MSKPIIFTKHALQRLDERSFSKRLVEETLESADKVLQGKETGTLEYFKKYSDFTVTAIATKNEEGALLVLSCWRDPPVYGTHDYRKKKRYKEFKRAGFWKRLWLDILTSFGL